MNIKILICWGACSLSACLLSMEPNDGSDSLKSNVVSKPGVLQDPSESLDAILGKIRLGVLKRKGSYFHNTNGSNNTPQTVFGTSFTGHSLDFNDTEGFNNTPQRIFDALSTGHSFDFNDTECFNNTSQPVFGTLLAGQDFSYGQAMNVAKGHGRISCDKFPVVASFGAGPCIIVGAYNGKKAFITYIDAITDYYSISKILNGMMLDGHLRFYLASRNPCEEINKKIEGLLNPYVQSGKGEIVFDGRNQVESLAVDGSSGKFTTNFDPKLLTSIDPYLNMLYFRFRSSRFLATGEYCTIIMNATPCQ